MLLAAELILVPPSAESSCLYDGNGALFGDRVASNPGQLFL